VAGVVTLEFFRGNLALHENPTQSAKREDPLADTSNTKIE
jgi:hypothetical protein